MLLIQQLCNAFSCEKADNIYSISRIIYGKTSNFSTLEVSTIKLGLVIVNKSRHTDTIYTFVAYLLISDGDSFISTSWLVIDDIMHFSCCIRIKMIIL